MRNEVSSFNLFSKDEEFGNVELFFLFTPYQNEHVRSSNLESAIWGEKKTILYNPSSSLCVKNFMNIKTLIFFCAALMVVGCSNDDGDKNELNPEWRYFRFSSCPSETHGRWQDSSFVAATADAAVIQQCLDQRNMFPLGQLGQGYAGYNTNASHQFSWHLIENDWELVELGAEIYDGCAYSDVELTNYIESVGRYGGWGNRVLEEITLDED